MSKGLIDTHCHLCQLTPQEVCGVVERAKAAGVERLICIGAGMGEDPPSEAIRISEAQQNVYCSVGVHPHDAGKYGLDTFEELISHPKVVAIGETGLDYFRDWSPFEEQRKLFSDTIALAKNANKPLIIHCREANEDTMRILKENKAEQVAGVFHCYSQSAEFAKELSDINFLVSYTGILTFKSTETIRQEAAKIPLGQIMLETDSPYMAPEPHRGQKCEPAHVPLIAKKLAEIKDLPIEEVVNTTSKNAELFFSLQ